MKTMVAALLGLAVGVSVLTALTPAWVPFLLFGIGAVSLAIWLPIRAGLNRHYRAKHAWNKGEWRYTEERR